MSKPYTRKFEILVTMNNGKEYSFIHYEIICGGSIKVNIEAVIGNKIRYQNLIRAGKHNLLTKHIASFEVLPLDD